MKILCFDVGGTNTKYAVLDEELNLTHKGRFPTIYSSLDDFIRGIEKIYEEVAEEVSGFAMSMPGVIDPVTGYVKFGGSLVSIIRDINLKDLIKERLGCPVSIANDAKCAAMAEIGYGSLKDSRNAIVITLGTGIGGCLVYNREVVYGSHLYSGEFSFIRPGFDRDRVIPWAHRNGAAGLLARVQERLGTDQQFTGEEIFAMAAEGNEKVLAALDQFTYELARQLYNLQCVFDPEKVAIGGGISEQPLLFEMLEKNLEAVREQFGRMSPPKPQVVTCQFNNDSNLLGAMYKFLQDREKGIN
ncbi:MAG: ROK family protein [Erysipelotrichaceae bacterium]|nr:ROK family protein [Erysipelotrichaceae bacterium]